MNPNLVRQYGFVKHTVKSGRHYFAAWKTTLRNGAAEIQVVIDASLSHNARLVHDEVSAARRLIGL